MSRTVPALLLSVVYAAALAVALTDLGQHAAAGLLVLGGLTARWFLRHRRAAALTAAVPAASAPVAVLTAVPDPLPGRVDVLPARAA
ncbi:hypothetical protein [Blastococcus sp. TF02A-26]|uniref:hypothetical protein n=1 Tax=Blastococcus sp. TF02A-26 TaxID=2250577 RepID=UPI0018F41137|nr:hypothetical protein [Blastococcus sp. TF02A-26]